MEDSGAKWPNENFVREQLEPFTAGIGSYAETDVQEVARARTGWTPRRGRESGRPWPTPAGRYLLPEARVG